jgi:hypothetical protein
MKLRRAYVWIGHQVEPFQAAIFWRRIFQRSTLLRSSTSAWEHFRVERNKKGNHVVGRPAPHRYPFFHKTTWKISIFIYQTDPLLASALNSHTRFIGVIRWLDLPLFGCPLARGGSRFHRPVTLTHLPDIGQPFAPLKHTACRWMSGRRNRAGGSVVKPRLLLAERDGLEA